ncbi:MAG: isochorismatase family cysteine hydrolase [Solirubrobacteraceae bacterium]|nr:isochorismatase family cysteine hydrolase [Solirubrobacteraceae bacterium]
MPTQAAEPLQRSVTARPYAFTFEPSTTALLIIDMQRDFLEPAGFGETLGNDVSLLAPVIPAVKSLLDAARSIGMAVIHTREGHRPDLTDLHEAKRVRGNPTLEIGDPSPNGRILVRGEYGHDIIDELAPIAGEAVIDKPGKGAFYATDLGLLLAKGGITSLIVTGVTTEVCVHTTVREANDRGFECLVVEDGTGSYFPEFHATALRMISAQGGIFGWTATSTEVLEALPGPSPTSTTTTPTTAETLSPTADPHPTPVTTGA